jgi:hypothetical protein
MKPASVVQLRQSLELAHTLVKHGIRFVCIPVVDEADAVNLANQAADRFERMSVIAEAAEQRP